MRWSRVDYRAMGSGGGVQDDALTRNKKTDKKSVECPLASSPPEGSFIQPQGLHPRDEEATVAESMSGDYKEPEKTVSLASFYVLAIQG